MNWAHWKKPDHFTFLLVGVSILLALIASWFNNHSATLISLAFAIFFWFFALGYDIYEEVKKHEDSSMKEC
jgi:Zn-dependent protease with chaperone function